MSSRLPRAGRLAGEFGVIVVGVLVALLAESWWDQRGERTREMEMLERIYEELPGDSARLAVWGQWLELVEPSLEVAREVLSGGDPLPAPPALALSYAAATQVSVERAVGTWDDLVASGGLADITDADLRQALVGFYGEFDALEEDGREVPDDYRIAVTALVPSPVTRRILENCILDEDRSPFDIAGPRPGVLERLRTCDVVDDSAARRGLDALRRRPGLSEALEARAYGIANVRDAHESAAAWFAVLRGHLDRVLDR